MKKFLSLFIGCLAALVIAVSFSACNPKDQNNADSGYSLVGTWKWVYEDYNYAYTLTVYKNNKGELIVVNSQDEQDIVAQCEFSWNEPSDNTIRLHIETGQVPGIGAAGDNVDFEYEFYGPDKVLFTLTDDPATHFGTFTRVTGGNGGGNSYADLSDFEKKLFGTWTWTMNGTTLNTLIINADHTGRVASINLFTQQNTQATFNWSVVSENVVRLYNLNGQLMGFDGMVPDPLVLNVSFPENNKVLFTMASNPDFLFGPFTKQ